MHKSIEVWKEKIEQGIYPVCYLCSKLITSVYDLSQDHIIPRSKAGKTTASNLMPTHRVCNHRKGSRTPEEWYELKRKRENE